MGWWKVQYTEDVVGDEVFTILREATKRIAALYEHELGRRPSRSEWQRLIQDGLEPVESMDSTEVRSPFVENSRPRAVEIVLESSGSPSK
jgi:hypothetical protein